MIAVSLMSLWCASTYLLAGVMFCAAIACLGRSMARCGFILRRTPGGSVESGGAPNYALYLVGASGLLFLLALRFALSA